MQNLLARSEQSVIIIHYMIRYWFFCAACALSLSASAAPVIDPIANANISAARSLILPVTATSPNGLPLTFAVSSSTDGILVEIETNNPFWKLSVVQAASPKAPGAYSTPFRGGTVTVTNMGDMTFMLFRAWTPHTVNVIQGLTDSGFYTSNTIFHRVVSGSIIQGGDPNTNGTGGPVFRFDDEYYPKALFTGNGQLAMANSGKDTDGSQFFVTIGPQRSLDFSYTLFGQLLRGFNVLTNIEHVAANGASRPLADVIITRASLVPDTSDTVLTLTGTNLVGVSGTISVIADDGAGGRTTNTFTATTVTNTVNDPPFIYPVAITNLVGPLNSPLTNTITQLDLDGDTNYWFGERLDSNSTNSFFTVTNAQMQLVVVPDTNFAGATSLGVAIAVSPNGPSSGAYDSQTYTFAFGDTPIAALGTNFVALSPFSDQVLAAFTNGVPNSPTDSFSAFINWGDNVTNSGVIATNLGGWKEVHGSHTYIHGGDYPIYVTIQSSLGASVTAVSIAAITVSDTTSPMLQVVSPTPGLRVTNALFAATGTASDNVAVATVFWQLNGGTWTTASGTNNWTADLTLTAGANVFSAYAADTSGNLSPTTTVSFVSVQFTALTVLTNGGGSFTPNRNGQSLEIGTTNLISARAAPGFRFVNWTSNLDGPLTNSTALNFIMKPGLVLTANFADIIKPTITVIAPKAGLHVSNSVFHASGTAKDNVAVAAVFYRLNGGPSTAAIGTTSWTASLTLVPGTNILSIYAADATPNFSATNAFKLVYVLSAPLTVQIAGGRGTITPNYNNKLLAISNSYSMTAVASPGFAFLNWSEGVPVTSTARLKFTMQSNLVIIANFKDISRPVNVISFPAVGQTVTNTPMTAAGKAKDNVGVSNVWVQLNGAGWNLVATTNSYTNWTAAGLKMPSGANLIQAFAVDGVGKVSRTNSVKFKYKVTPVLEWAPDSLNGLLVQVQPDGGSAESAGFDLGTFAQAGAVADTNADDYGVGTYGYIKTGTNTAQLMLTNTLPPNLQGGGPETITLVFTNHYTALFTNESGNGGTLSAAVSGVFVPATLAGRTVAATLSSGNKTTIVLSANGTFSKTPSNSGIAGASKGIYEFTRFSPTTEMLKLTFTDSADAGQRTYVQATFKSAIAGGCFVSSFDNTGTLTDTQVGTFVLK
jgi:cyclophilin family peptidyl-prolyl cis-trans isomerase